VQWNIFPLNQYQFIAYVVTIPSRKKQTFSVEKVKNLMPITAFAPAAIRNLRVGASHSMGHLFLRKILKKR
jgi:hypothetical protein